MSFNIGLSGLYAANKQLDVTGNNIANVATTGFKSSRAEFEDVYSATKLGSGSKTVGNGVRLSNVSQQFGQGDVNNTGNVLDMGIQGQGFFVLSNDGSLSYTRAGTFKTDKEGYITNSDGTSKLQGYGVDANGKIQNGILTDLRIDTSNLPPQATSLVSSTINLNSTATAITAAFNPADTSTFTKQFTTPVYDTQGNQHSMDQYMVKTGSNTWNVYTLIDGRNLDGSSPTAAATLAVPSTMTFDSSGKLTQVSTPAVPAPIISNDLVLSGWVPGTVTNGVWAPNGAGSSTITLSLTNTTQFNADTARSLPVQNGYATGQITNLTIDGSGVLLANFSNNQTKPIGQLALASFTNEQGLQPVGGTSWKETFDSGIPAYDAPTTGTLGSIVSNALEESNVNLTNELVELIKAQSNYQANAKTISTQSTIMQTIIQMA
ncbi:flagellar hook-basal body complex protein [Pseudomonas mediterranea]|uniref:Flagellar hook protein FlgE n=1 Tax=Pseudomonas mediterranea TaxID=183795 RepID=A0AAX2DA59_9PSED|nr:flagellar hook protein FlgE [Pseudomonas mediterranea]KGU85460.1 flagellar hook protein FlgE [Pseudomonas mediterranea CFBP 5447]MBL0844926.1 flagellar hook protein FlgE [Pseudomonas mediterranea]MDU9027121.1 flagellar hook protein FlgE [Pseudomonas mediterranea]QHA84056.1 flagellar hook-basal body complex protein [Pseudomonas mediterranea]CAH0244397.1 Flagellar hook protein FlgE [Pseudomonas mediterranea]